MHFGKLRRFCGLINSARQILWDIVDFVARKHKKAELRVALLTHGSGGTEKHGYVIIDKTTIYKPVQKVKFPALHTIVTCDLSQPQLSCPSQGIGWFFHTHGARDFHV